MNLYSNGLPYTDGVTDNIESGIKRVDNRTATVWVIDGGLGQGKTTMATHLVDYHNKIKGLPPMDIRGPQYAMGGLEFEEKIEVCFEQKLPCIVYDESADYNRKGAMTKFNSMLNRIFQTVRGYNCVIIMVLPCFVVLDSDLYTNDIVQGLFHLYGKKQGCYGNFKLYDQHSMMYMKRVVQKTRDPKAVYNFTIPNLVGHFKDLEKERSDLLDTVGMDKKRKIKNQARIDYEGLLSYDTLAKKLFRSVDRIRKIINLLKIQPIRTIKRVKYFSSDTVNILVDHIELMKQKDYKEKE